jgi:hypothetical protein
MKRDSVHRQCIFIPFHLAATIKTLSADHKGSLVKHSMENALYSQHHNVGMMSDG